MILDGKKISQEILKELKDQIDHIKAPRAPTLAYILVGDNPASAIYVKHKVRACEKLGITAKGHFFDSNVSQKQLLSLVQSLNKDPTVDGILVQIPLPIQINLQQIIETIDPQKDVDGFHPFNLGRLLNGTTPYFVPCTPLGVHEMLKRSGIEIAHKQIVIMGRSNIVGKPLAALLMQKTKHCNATVTVVHSHSAQIESITSCADILIAAMGSPHFVNSQMVKKGAVVIDVGINRHLEKLVGDVDFESVHPIASHISPVPGGVGPMTIAMLMANTIKSCQMRLQLT